MCHKQQTVGSEANLVYKCAAPGGVEVPGAYASCPSLRFRHMRRVIIVAGDVMLDGKVPLSSWFVIGLSRFAKNEFLPA
jgi:hypothetical protein